MSIHVSTNDQNVMDRNVLDKMFGWLFHQWHWWDKQEMIVVQVLRLNVVGGAFNKFPDFFYTGIYNCRRLLKIQYVIAIHLMRWLTKLYDFRFKWTATAGIGIQPTKVWLSQLVNFKNAICIWQHIRKMICNKISVLNLEKMSQKRMEYFRLLLEHLAWIKHQFLSGIRDSRKAQSLWEMMGGVAGVRKSIHQSWLAKGLGLRLGLLCWGFKGVQEEIPREEASTLQIESVAFPPGQCTSPQLHSHHRLFDQDGHQDSSSASLKSRPCSLWLLVIP